ncbi:MAG: hypothetical protein Q8P41_19740 [Pseudomonadota bacterium]|nr:hypothetical protein [Pseudomonadota bacterium]
MNGAVGVGATSLATRFAVPSGPAERVLEALDDAGLGLARARIAARLGDPDPFHVRVALTTETQPVTGTVGVALTPDAADAVLLAADVVRGTDPDPALAGLFAGRPPGPCARAVPVDDARRSWLRWQFRPTRPARVGEVQSWTAAEIGDTEVATIRCVQPLPGGAVALGSDYGLTIWKNGTFSPFPWPLGSRREARRVESMAVHRGHLHIATTQTLYVWDFAAKVTSRRHGPDEEDGFDDLNALLSAGDRLYAAYRTRFEGGVGPPDAIAMAADPTGVVYAGTRDGELHVVDGGGPIRRFADQKPRPVRHLAWAEGSLWVAALGTLHRFDGAAWSAHGPEPTALAVDPEGRLWALAEGRLHLLVAGTLQPVDVALERPWSLAAVAGGLWIGGRERAWHVRT